jgi:hypothetical protein
MLWLPLFVELAGILHERLALANKRAELATDPAAKKAAIDEGLIVADSFQKLLDKIKGFIGELNDHPVTPGNKP